MISELNQAFDDAYKLFGADVALAAYEKSVVKKQQYQTECNLLLEEFQLLTFLNNLPLGNL